MGGWFSTGRPGVGGFTARVASLAILAHGSLGWAQDGTYPVVALDIQKQADFTILLARANSTATGAVFLGFIGAGIEDGIRYSRDSDLQSKLVGHVPPDCQSNLVAALSDHLRVNSGTLLPLDQVESETVVSHYIELKVDHCGLRKVNDADEMSAFIEARYKIYARADEEPKELTRLYMLGRQSGPWSRYESQPELANRELLSVLQQAGRRLANKVLFYRAY